jgi:signal transduction histidine kinase
MRSMIAATISFVRNTGRIASVERISLGALLQGIVADEQELGRPVTAGVFASIHVLGDKTALCRLFQNLVDNAVAYGGNAEIGLAAVDQKAGIRISDRGPGLSDDMLETMFKPFERGDPSRNRTTGGIGLGLSIARAIAQEHGGSLVLKAREGGGITALCCLPIVPDRL